LGWTCSVCGERHDEELRDIRCSLPDAVFRVREPERSERAEVGDDWCRFLDDAGVARFYLRALLHLPIARTPDDFRFGVWVEVDEPDFYRLGELWDDDDALRPFFGRLANDLDGYDETAGLPVALQLRQVNLLPSAILLGSGHRLVDEQRSGMSQERARRLAEAALH
jgi:hypothetical protein